MAKLLKHSVRTTVETVILLELSEAEARALDGIFGYDVETFLRVFYERMGKAYVQPHEEGVRSLHATIRQVVAEPLRKTEDAKMALKTLTQNSK